MADKDHLNMIITGHIDNGKSTTMGHFLLDLGVVDERTISAHAKESEETGKGDSFKYAWVMDNIKDERARGITIDLAFQKFETPKFFFTLIDAPGHRDFIKNMITGASEADAAVLVLSAKEGETDTAIAPGGQAREHAFLLKTLGVKQLIVAINKMDDSKFSEDAFNAAKQRVRDLLSQLDIKLRMYHSFLFLDGLEKILLKNLKTCHGIRAKLFWKHLMTLKYLKNQQVNHYDYQYKMFIQLPELVLFL